MASMKMKLCLRGIAEQWLEGKRAMGRSLTTDGRRLYSYMLPIAEVDKEQNVVRVLLGEFVSSTTSTHLNVAMATARSWGFKIEWPKETDSGSH